MYVKYLIVVSFHGTGRVIAFCKKLYILMMLPIGTNLNDMLRTIPTTERMKTTVCLLYGQTSFSILQPCNTFTFLLTMRWWFLIEIISAGKNNNNVIIQRYDIRWGLDRVTIKDLVIKIRYLTFEINSGEYHPCSSNTIFDFLLFM